MNIEAFVWIFVCSQNNSKWIFSLLALYSTHALYSLLPPLYPPTFYHSITSVFLHPLFLLLHTPTQWSFISFFSFLFLLLRFCSISSSLLYFLLFCYSAFLYSIITESIECLQVIKIGIEQSKSPLSFPLRYSMFC